MDLPGFRRGIELFNSREFFDAHEALEDVWRASVNPDRKLLQGLIQVAVAFHHHGNGNAVGARSLLKRACSNLADGPENFFGIELRPLQQSLLDWQIALSENHRVPPYPRLKLSDQCDL